MKITGEMMPRQESLERGENPFEEVALLDRFSIINIGAELMMV